jgi:DnaJ-class molecular chaperone
MKDYYQILGVSENDSREEIKKAFRRLAFQHHPDRNPGNEGQAEQRFKEINEAYGVLGYEAERREYDAFRRGQFAGVGYDNQYWGLQYSQEDIFRYIFSNRAIFDELSRMFSQAGLRFDQDFLNKVFFGSRGFVYETTPHRTEPLFDKVLTHKQKPNLIEGIAGKVANKMLRYTLKKTLGFEVQSLPAKGSDLHQDLILSSKEAASGCEKQISYKRGKESKKLMVKVPPGVTAGTKIRLNGMGLEGRQPGDLYLRIKVKK